MISKAFAFASALLLTAQAMAEPEVMRPIEVNGYQVVDAEYLPFIGNQPVRYPADVLWGFYPSGSTEAARGCALVSYRTLVDLLSSDSPDLHEVVSLGGTPRFVLWINDYSRSSPRPAYRTAHLWHRGTTAQDFAQGSWTWETTLTPHGECLQPSAQQICDMLRLARQVLSSQQAAP